MERFGWRICRSTCREGLRGKDCIINEENCLLENQFTIMSLLALLGAVESSGRQKLWVSFRLRYMYANHLLIRFVMDMAESMRRIVLNCVAVVGCRGDAPSYY